jgi:hypothetical protein
MMGLGDFFDGAERSEAAKMKENERKSRRGGGGGGGMHGCDSCGDTSACVFCCAAILLQLRTWEWAGLYDMIPPRHEHSSAFLATSNDLWDRDLPYDTLTSHLLFVWLEALTSSSALPPYSRLPYNKLGSFFG